MQLSDCRALITGASGGIGQALVERLCQGGAKLLLAGRQLAPLEGLVQRFPGQVELVCADITEVSGREAVLAAARRFGGMNTLINAAGVNRFSLLEQHDEADIAALIGLNVTATLQLTHRLLPLLRQQGEALVVNLGSTFGSIGYPGFSAYCASKFALRGFSEALRRELADTQVKVLYFAPRATRTPMNAPSVVAMNWGGIFAPANTPEPIVKRLSDAVGQALNSPEVTAALDAVSSVKIGMPHEQFTPFVATEAAKWAEVIRKSGASL